MLRRIALTASLSCLLLVTPAWADRTAALSEALRLGDLMEIMREEGRDHGRDIGATLLGREGSRDWNDAVARIYAADRMLALMEDRIEAELADDPEALAVMVDFFASDRGRRVVELEISARRAMLDDEIDTAAREAWDDLREADTARADLLRRFADAGDLIEANVVGGLNSTYAFYRGMLEGGGGPAMDEADVLADVWAQEPGIRAEIEEWLFGYLTLAYGPLALEDLELYTAFFESPEGRALNAALFLAFHGMFETLSEDLGRAVGLRMQGEDL